MPAFAVDEKMGALTNSGDVVSRNSEALLLAAFIFFLPSPPLTFRFQPFVTLDHLTAR
jgi:hypothetical protein